MDQSPIFFTKKGKGKPVVFLHGLWGGGNYFREFDSVQLAGYELYFPDELGFGKSPKPNIEYTPRVHCEALMQILPKDKKLVLIGHSFGTSLAIYFAKYFPERVEKLILISPLAYNSIEEAKKFLSTRLITRLTIERPFVAKLICKTVCSTGILGLISPFFVRGHKRKYIGGCTNHTWHSYYSSFVECLLSEPLAPVLDRISVTIPTLLVYGDKDNYTSSQEINQMVGKKLKVVKTSGGHNLFFDKMAWSQDLIGRFAR